MTTNKIVYQPMRFGLTTCQNGRRFLVDSMERHVETEEIIVCVNGSLILSVASSDPSDAPRSEDVRSFVLQQGDLVMLNKGIWHDACQAIDGKAFYYFMAHGSGKGDEIVWHPLDPEPITIDLDSLRIEDILHESEVKW